MSWDYNFADKARKQLKKLGPEPAGKILSFLDEKIAGSEDPRAFGKALTGNLTDLWRYRAGPYRIVCHLNDETLIVLVVKVGHRKDIYR